jgi:hypothetical protein
MAAAATAQAGAAAGSTTQTQRLTAEGRADEKSADRPASVQAAARARRPTAEDGHRAAALPPSARAQGVASQDRRAEDERAKTGGLSRLSSAAGAEGLAAEGRDIAGEEDPGCSAAVQAPGSTAIPSTEGGNATTIISGEASCAARMPATARLTPPYLTYGCAEGAPRADGYATEGGGGRRGHTGGGA